MGEETTRYKDNSDLLTNVETKPVPITARVDKDIELGNCNKEGEEEGKKQEEMESENRQDDKNT